MSPTVTAILLPTLSMLIGAFIRGSKEGGSLPWNIPARWRPWVAVVLGIVAAAIDKVAAGASWKEAGIIALSGAGAIVAHELGIESVREGKELPVLAKDSPPPPPPLNITIKGA